MSLPVARQIERPILQELSVVGGTDNLRFLYQRLISYFPSLSDAEISQIQNETNAGWRKIVQIAGKSLSEDGLLVRKYGIWTLSKKGLEIAAEKKADFLLTKTEAENFSHTEIQNLTAEIGRLFGFYAELEFEYFDVIWREKENSPRISHVFEVQSKGNIDSAFAKLKRAFDAQRSKPFLIVANERDTKRAKQSLNREFRELENHLTVLSFAEIKKIYDNIFDISDVLTKLLEK
ncbi:MAG: hypothetical protein ACR2J3_05835 [Aridibacter sp.]